MSLKSYFARHSQTLIGSLGRIVHQPFATAMTVGVIAVALSLPLFLNLLLSNVRSATGNWNDAFELSVYLDKQAAAARAPALAQQLRLRGDVASVRVITADEAMAQFRQNSGFGKALDALSENPLPDTLVVTPSLGASSPGGTDALKLAISGMADVETVQLDTDWVKRLYAILDIVRRVVWLTAGLLGAGVILVVGNTIRLDILNRRAEIEVMKLVGATDGFARRPFLYSGLWYGLGGGLLAVILVSAAAAVLADPVDRLAKLYGTPFVLQGLALGESTAVVLLGVGLAWVGSWLAATRHIRGIEPS